MAERFGARGDPTWRALFETLPCGLVLVEVASWEVLAANGAFGRLLGLPCEDLVGQPFGTWLPPGVREEVLAAATALEPGELRTLAERIASVGPGGRWIRLTGARLADAEGRGLLVGLVEDISMRVQQARHLDVLGRLAGGVAHDLNNVLAIVMLFGQAVIDGLPADDPCRDDAITVLEAAQRGVDLSLPLLAFGRRAAREPVLMEVGEVVVGTEKVLRRLLGEAIALRVEIERGCGLVRADRGEVAQVLLSLVMNAREAVGDSGAVIVGVRPVARAGAGSPGWIELSVADDGRGMTPREVERAFEPSSPHRSDSRGVGLELSAVRALVAHCGGRVEVESAPGRGARFASLWPCVGPLAAGGEGLAEEDVPGGGETLLLVDDDPALLRGLATALRRRGYRVIEASGAGDALLAAELHPGRIDLLVTEVSLPRLDGLQVARRLGARDPGIGMLFLAGAESGLPEVAPCLLKPFTPAALVRRVRAVLDGRG